MISNFIGEFLIHPSPLELSGETCVHNCAYCFANIRSTKRQATLQTDIKLLTGHSTSKAICNEFFKRGYSICISNRSDPFCKSNDLNTPAIFSILAKQKNPLFIQTKGGDKALRMLDMLSDNKVVLYVTITSTNTAITKKVEPNAPPVKDRIKLIREATKMGIPCVVGINPCVQEWWPGRSLQHFEKMITDAGALSFLMQKLHFSKQGIKRLSTFKYNSIGKNILNKAIEPGDLWFQEQVVRQIEEGYNTLTVGMPFPTTFFEPIREKLGLTLPQNYDFINWCSKKKNGIATFNDFKYIFFNGHGWLAERIDKAADRYILCRNRSIWRHSKRVQSIISFVDVLREFWNNARLRVSLQNNMFFQLVVDDNDHPVCDLEGNIRLHFDGDVHRDSRTWKE